MIELIAMAQLMGRPNEQAQVRDAIVWDGQVSGYYNRDFAEDARAHLCNALVCVATAIAYGAETGENFDALHDIAEVWFDLEDSSVTG